MNGLTFFLVWTAACCVILAVFGLVVDWMAKWGDTMDRDDER